MKTRFVIVFLIMIMLISCGTNVTFETPQPTGGSDINGIPKKFVGKYEPLKQSSYDAVAYDSDVLQIYKDLIVETIIFDSSTLLDSTERALYHRDTTFSMMETGDYSDVAIKGDSAFYHTISKDTLFSSLRGDVLRKFKGHYFLNQKTRSGKWSVRKLSKFKDGLIVGTISSTADLDKLKVISESEPDTVHNFKLTRKQFKEFINANGFTDEKVFVKAE